MTEFIYFALGYALGTLTCFLFFVFFMGRSEEYDETLIHTRHLRDEHEDLTE